MCRFDIPSGGGVPDVLNWELLDDIDDSILGISGLGAMISSWSASAATDKGAGAGGATVLVFIKKRKTDPWPSSD